VSAENVLRELVEALQEHRAQHYDEPDILVTTEFRKRLLRSIGWDENLPYSIPERIYGHRMILDDGIPAEPGFRVEGEHL
jgi:hypothetical protein